MASDEQARARKRRFAELVQQAQAAAEGGGISEQEVEAAQARNAEFRAYAQKLLADTSATPSDQRPRKRPRRGA